MVLAMLDKGMNEHACNKLVVVVGSSCNANLIVSMKTMPRNLKTNWQLQDTGFDAEIS